MEKALSPSSRRAWIEIIFGAVVAKQSVVALLAEGVDRNAECHGLDNVGIQSPSSRRAWIEIDTGSELLSLPTVALLAEGVDRNSNVDMCIMGSKGRPPRGGRG